MLFSITDLNVVIMNFMPEAISIDCESHNVAIWEIRHDKSLSRQSQVAWVVQDRRSVQAPQKVAKRGMNQNGPI